MKRKTKILISALSVMFVAAIAVAIASFSFAGNGDEDGLLENGEIIADASQNVDTKTIIDYIIDNSNSEDPEVDKIYHIAEISSSSASSLETFVSSNGFKDYAFQFGAPPHAGMAPGVDRMIMLLRNEENIREVIPFPMSGTAQDLMCGAPNEVTEQQLREVHIKVRQ